MAGKAQTKRKDKDRIVLRKGESQRKNGTYHFSWTDKLHHYYINQNKLSKQLCRVM